MSTRANNAYAVPQTTIGLAVETTTGTPVAPAFWIPVKSPKYKVDLTMIPDETLQGSMVEVYAMTPGMRYDSHGWDSFPYMDSFPNLVRAELGSSDNLTAAGSATTLYQPALAGATIIATNGTIASGQYIVIGSGATLETHKVASVSSSGPYDIHIDFPLVYPQAAGVTVTPLTVHQFSLLNQVGTGNGTQPPSYTLTDSDGEEWRQLAASQMDELTIKGNATGYVDYTCTWDSNFAVTPSPPSPSFTTAKAIPGWTAQMAIGGAYVNYIVTWEAALKRSVENIPALTGSQEYYQHFANALMATAKITIIEQNGSPQLNAFEAGTNQSFDFTVYDTASGWALNLHSSSALYTTGELDRSKKQVEVPLDIQFLPTTTDALAGGVSPLIVTCANAQASSY